MAIVTTDSKHYSNIAAAIREKTGGTDKLTVDEMPGQIIGIKSYADGYDDGFADCYSKGGLLAYARSARCLFAGAIFPEDVDLVMGSQYPGVKVTPDFTSAFQSAIGVKNLKFDCAFDIQPCDMVACFRGCSAETLEVPFMETVAITDYTGCFQKMTNLKEIKTPINAGGNPNFSYCFDSGTIKKLFRVCFVEKTIGASLSFSACPVLDDISIQSIIDGLADLTGQTAQKVTFHADVLLRLTDEQIATTLAKNWKF